MTLTHLTDLLSAVAVGMALISGAATLASTGQAAISLAVLLDLLMAAGLLHLAANPTIIRAASAAIVLVVRQLVSWSLSERGQGQVWPAVADGPNGRSSGPRFHALTVAARARRLRLRDVGPAAHTGSGCLVWLTG